MFLVTQKSLRLRLGEAEAAQAFYLALGGDELSLTGLTTSLCKDYNISRMINPLTIKGNYKSAWQIVRECLLSEADELCQVCGQESAGLSVHHRDGHGLNNAYDNLIVVCAACHSRLHQDMREAWRARVKQLFRKNR